MPVRKQPRQAPEEFPPPALVMKNQERAPDRFHPDSLAPDMPPAPWPGEEYPLPDTPRTTCPHSVIRRTGQLLLRPVPKHRKAGFPQTRQRPDAPSPDIGDTGAAEPLPRPPG